MEGAKIVMMKDEYEGIKKENWMKEALNREWFLQHVLFVLPSQLVVRKL